MTETVSYFSSNRSPMTLIEHLSVVKETRSDINRQYDMIDVIFLVVSAIMGHAPNS
ncbi:protein of unknown function [Xenorhabdus bovienii]|uniref:Uncharacterized protein n=1 Tax=Xenorhabdus bovienii TaxID=40576 RepID=A0A0B6X350_XENBV|nr:hypothetical protein [Xenorhabdus bovienii]CDM87561.1 protein of unknown function [Xenorhabdus bovienii]